MAKVSEKVITQALNDRYSKGLDHVFARQVKLGSAGSKIIDAVAIKKTWSPVTVIGHEIKISRQDFLGDNKYPEYMKACTNFYFVCVNGIADKSEVPKDVGLMIFYPESGTLQIKKKAPYYNRDISAEMLLHIIFWKLDEYNRPKTKAEQLDDIKAKIEARDYGLEVAYKIRELEHKLDRAKMSNGWDELKEKIREKYDTSIFDADDVIEMIAYNPKNIQSTKNIKRYVERLSELVKDLA